jgi:ADP-heptose:LPS heptosyltransferase
MVVNSAAIGNQSPRILLIRRRYLGDLVLLGVAIAKLRAQWPQAHISVMTESAYAGVLTMNANVNAVIAFPHSASDWWAIWRQMRWNRIDLLLDFDNRDKTAFISMISGARQRLALHNGLKVHLRWVYTDAELVPLDFLIGRHVTSYFDRLLVRAGVLAEAGDFSLIPRECDVNFVRQLPSIAELPAALPRLLVHPGSRSEFRLWPPENFAAVLNKLHSEKLASVTLISGPTEQALVDAIQASLDFPAHHIRQTLTLPQLGAVLAKYDVLLCHDSGPMHVAAAVGTPVIALFGAQGSTVFAPLGLGHELLSPPIPCVNCVTPRTCVAGDTYRMRCVRHISVDSVFAAAKRVLARASPKS